MASTIVDADKLVKIIMTIELAQKIMHGHFVFNIEESIKNIYKYLKEYFTGSKGIVLYNRFLKIKSEKMHWYCDCDKNNCNICDLRYIIDDIVKNNRYFEYI